MSSTRQSPLAAGRADAMSPLNMLQLWFICVLTFVLGVAIITERPEWFNGVNGNIEITEPIPTYVGQ